MKVRDDDLDLRVSRIETTPKFVQARVLPAAEDQPGHYCLEVEIPKNSPTCDRMAPRTGTIRLEFDHPRIKDLDLKAHFAVISAYST